MLFKRDKAIVMTFLLTGIRCSALVELNCDDIDFIDQTITIITKGNKHQVFNVPELFPCLEEWIAERNNMNVDTDALFVSNRKNVLAFLW